MDEKNGQVEHSNLEKIRIGAVSYLNTKPLIYGFEKGALREEADLIFEYPSKIAELLIQYKIDIGLVPVAVLPEMKEYHIIGEYCIGAINEVASVCLFSDCPLNEIKRIYLDYQSRTSVALLKILLKQYWKISVELINGEAGFEEKIIGDSAGLVIGDRAFHQRLKSKYAFDLAAAWIAFTRLPFVFAAWVSNKRLDEKFVQSFNLATGLGLKNIDEIVSKIHLESYDLKKYYTENIDYNLTPEKLKGLDLFLEKLKILS